MKERGIIFNTEMIRAIHDGRKTQTRRRAQFKPREYGLNLTFSGLKSGNYCNGSSESGFVLLSMSNGCWSDKTYPLHCPYGKPGEIINFMDIDGNIIGKIEILNIRIERLQSISQEDALAEGAPPSHHSIDSVSRLYGFPNFSISWFAQVWWRMYGKESWYINSWVWVIEFKRV
ncbi:hypothetical protein [Providencia alcalifaciens]|uniref:hypothetical protein n=1 Tax=Providencia alcalifaciens TaxID=126385 RepID=UPI001901617F|nr:hypothetical protein [Providencia alcalifaciens]